MPTYWINGKRHFSDRDLTPDELESLSGPSLKPTPQKSFIKSAWETLSTPLTTAPQKAASRFNEMFMGQSDLGLQAANDLVPGMGTGLSMIGGFGRGVVEGLGNVATQLTSPIDLASLALGGGELAAARAATSGLRGAEGAAAAARTAQNLGRARQIASAPVAAHGAVNLIHGESTPMERLMAIPEAAGGLAGTIAPIYSGGARYQVPPPDFNMADMGNVGPYGPTAPINRQLPPAPPPELPIRPPMRELPPGVMEGEILNPVDLAPPPVDPRITSIAPETITPDIISNPIDDLGRELGGYAGPPARTTPPVEIPPEFMNRIPELPIQDRTLTQDINNAMSELAARRTARQTDDLVSGMRDDDRGIDSTRQANMNLIDRIQDPELREAELTRFEDLVEREPDEIIQIMREENHTRLPEAEMILRETNPAKIAENLQKLNTQMEELAKIAYEPRNPTQQREFDNEYEDLGTLQTLATAKYERATQRTLKGEPAYSQTEEGLIKLDVGDAEDVIPIMANTYAGHTVSVAGKELIQNALDAVKDLGGKGKISVNIDPMQRRLTVSDTGPGLTKQELATIYTDLSRSGKRGRGDTIGEMGFGKMAYLATGEKVFITTISKDPTTGKLMKYSLGGTPQELIKGVRPTEEIAPPGSTTGTIVEYIPKSDENFSPLNAYVENLKKYSTVHTPMNVRTHDWIGKESIFEIPKGTLNPKEVIGSGQSKGAKFAISVPENAQELPKQANVINLILVNRGMFQGVDQFAVPFGISNMPDRLVVNIEPIVDAKSPDYPLTVPTRERLTWRTKLEVDKVIKDKIINEKIKNRDAEIQRIYDNAPVSALGNFVIQDTGARFTPEEAQYMLDSPLLSTIADEMQKMVSVLSDIFAPELLNATVEKVGFVFDIKLRGVNIANPSDPKKMAVFINPGILLGYKDVSQTVNGILHTTLHEFAHTMARDEGKDFTRTLGNVYEKFGIEKQEPYAKVIRNAIAPVKNGVQRNNPEVQEILSRYNESRRREATSPDLLIREGISQSAQSAGQERVSFSRESDGEGTPPPLGREVDRAKASALREGWNLPRGLMSVDMPFVTSAALRQGLPWVASRYWWEAWVKQAQAFGSEKAYRNQIDVIERDNLFRPQARFRGQGNKPIFDPSIAEQMGLVLTDLTDLTSREEVLKSTWAERIPVYGKWVRGSNRAYTSFLNHIRSSAFKQLTTDMGAWNGRVITNEPLAREISNFINTTTGRGSGKLTLGISKDKSATLDLERVMGPLGEVFFSPRLWKSRLDMLNPSTYILASPQIRKQWIKAWLATVGAWWGIASLLEMMGATVSKDPNNSDFGKARIGNTRIDPGGGFQQNLVIANRILNPLGKNTTPIQETGVTPIDLATGPLRFGGGGITSPVSGRFQPYGQEFRGETRMSDALRFTANKLHPSGKYIYDFFNRNKRQPFYLGDRTAQLFVPMFAGDLAETIMTDPGLAVLSLGASSIGMGAQTFEGGPGKPTFTPLTGLEAYDPTFR